MFSIRCHQNIPGLPQFPQFSSRMPRNSGYILLFFRAELSMVAGATTSSTSFNLHPENRFVSRVSAPMAGQGATVPPRTCSAPTPDRQGVLGIPWATSRNLRDMFRSPSVKYAGLTPRSPQVSYWTGTRSAHTVPAMFTVPLPYAGRRLRRAACQALRSGIVLVPQLWPACLSLPYSVPSAPSIGSTIR
jgi:hypothetical protein